MTLWTDCMPRMMSVKKAVVESKWTDNCDINSYNKIERFLPSDNNCDSALYPAIAESLFPGSYCTMTTRSASQQLLHLYRVQLISTGPLRIISPCRLSGFSTEVVVE